MISTLILLTVVLAALVFITPTPRVTAERGKCTYADGVVADLDNALWHLTRDDPDESVTFGSGEWSTDLDQTFTESVVVEEWTCENPYPVPVPDGATFQKGPAARGLLPWNRRVHGHVYIDPMMNPMQVRFSPNNNPTLDTYYHDAPSLTIMQGYAGLMSFWLYPEDEPLDRTMTIRVDFRSHRYANFSSFEGYNKTYKYTHGSDVRCVECVRSSHCTGYTPADDNTVRCTKDYTCCTPTCWADYPPFHSDGCGGVCLGNVQPSLPTKPSISIAVFAICIVAAVVGTTLLATLVHRIISARKGESQYRSLDEPLTAN